MVRRLTPPRSLIDRWIATANTPEGDPAYEAALHHASELAAAIGRHLQLRAEGWPTRTLWAVHEAYEIAADLRAPERIPGRYEYDAVTAALTPGGGEDPDPLAAVALTDDVKRGQYAGELTAWGRKVAALLFTGPKPTEDEARATVGTTHGPALRWDADFANVLEGMGGKRARELAEAVREKAAKRAAADPPLGGDLWKLWADLERGNGYAPRWLEALARALWHDKWKPALVRERRPVALPVAGWSMVMGVLAGRTVEPGADGRDVLVDREGRAVGRFEAPRLATAVYAEALEALALGGVRELATVAAARFVPWFAHAVQRRPDETAALVFEGAAGVNAYGTVAGAMGMDPEKHASAVRGLLMALQCTWFEYAGREGGLLMAEYDGRRGRGHRSRLKLTPSSLWLSATVHDLPEGAEHRALAPIPLLPNFAPPFVGDPSERGALARLYLRILAELAHGNRDLASGIGAHIPGARWAELAREEGVRRPPPLLVTLVQDRWTRDGDDGPAVFERVGPDRWHLAPRFAAEREMLEAGGKQRIGASVGGKLAAKAKAEARGRLADGKRGKGRR